MKDKSLEQLLKIKTGYVRLIVNCGIIFLVLLLSAVGIQLFSMAYEKAFNSKGLGSLEILLIIICISHLAILWVVKIKSGFMNKFLSGAENLDKAISLTIDFFRSILFFVVFDGLGGSLCYAKGAPLYVLASFWFYALTICFVLFPSYVVWKSWFERYLL